MRVTCVGGPYDGATIIIHGTSANYTFVFTAKGQTGRYKDGKWVPYKPI